MLWVQKNWKKQAPEVLQSWRKPRGILLWRIPTNQVKNSLFFFLQSASSSGTHKKRECIHKALNIWKDFYRNTKQKKCADIAFLRQSLGQGKRDRIRKEMIKFADKWAQTKKVAWVSVVCPQCSSSLHSSADSIMSSYAGRHGFLRWHRHQHHAQQPQCRHRLYDHRQRWQHNWW